MQELQKPLSTPQNMTTGYKRNMASLLSLDKKSEYMEKIVVKMGERSREESPLLKLKVCQRILYIYFISSERSWWVTFLHYQS